MKKVICGLVLCSISLFAEIYVCMPFFNELNVLEIHLNELYDHVDYFVISESCESFSGVPKPFYFEENKERFAPFLDKIKHLKSYKKIKTDNPWDREEYQRNYLLEGLKDCKSDDLILLCDCDEIVSAEAIKKGVDLVKDKSIIVLFNIGFYQYYLNRTCHVGWRAPVLSHYETFKSVGPKEMRLAMRYEPFMKITKNQYKMENVCGGWHFTSFGGPPEVKFKMQSYSHAKDVHVLDFVSDFDAKFSDRLNELTRIEIDDRFPQFVLDNLDLMDQWGFIEH